MSGRFGQRRHACKIVNLRQPNLSWLEGQGRPARAMGISVSLLGMALQSRPAYACSCIPAAIHHPDHVDTSICWLLGSKHEDTTTQATPSSSHEHVLESILLVLLLNYSIPSPWHQSTLNIHHHHQKHPTTAPQPPHAHTHVHPRKEIPISPAPESLNSTPMNAPMQPSAREPSDVDGISETSTTTKKHKPVLLLPFLGHALFLDVRAILATHDLDLQDRLTKTFQERLRFR